MSQAVPGAVAVFPWEMEIAGQLNSPLDRSDPRPVKAAMMTLLGEVKPYLEECRLDVKWSNRRVSYLCRILRIFLARLQVRKNAFRNKEFPPCLQPLVSSLLSILIDIQILQTLKYGTPLCRDEAITQIIGDMLLFTDGSTIWDTLLKISVLREKKDKELTFIVLQRLLADSDQEVRIVRPPDYLKFLLCLRLWYKSSRGVQKRFVIAKAINQPVPKNFSKWIKLHSIQELPPYQRKADIKTFVKPFFKTMDQAVADDLFTVLSNEELETNATTEPENRFYCFKPALENVDGANLDTVSDEKDGKESEELLRQISNTIVDILEFPESSTPDKDKNEGKQKRKPKRFDNLMDFDFIDDNSLESPVNFWNASSSVENASSSSATYSETLNKPSLPICIDVSSDSELGMPKQSNKDGKFSSEPRLEPKLPESKLHIPSLLDDDSNVTVAKSGVCQKPLNFKQIFPPTSNVLRWTVVTESQEVRGSNLPPITDKSNTLTTAPSADQVSQLYESYVFPNRTFGDEGVVDEHLLSNINRSKNNRIGRRRLSSSNCLFDDSNFISDAITQSTQTEFVVSETSNSNDSNKKILPDSNYEMLPVTTVLSNEDSLQLLSTPFSNSLNPQNVNALSETLLMDSLKVNKVLPLNSTNKKQRVDQNSRNKVADCGSEMSNSLVRVENNVTCISEVVDMETDLNPPEMTKPFITADVVVETDLVRPSLNSSIDSSHLCLDSDSDVETDAETKSPFSSSPKIKSPNRSPGGTKDVHNELPCTSCSSLPKIRSRNKSPKRSRDLNSKSPSSSLPNKRNPNRSPERSKESPRKRTSNLSRIRKNSAEENEVVFKPLASCDDNNSLMRSENYKNSSKRTRLHPIVKCKSISPSTKKNKIDDISETPESAARNDHEIDFEDPVNMIKASRLFDLDDSTDSDASSTATLPLVTPGNLGVSKICETKDNSKDSDFSDTETIPTDSPSRAFVNIQDSEKADGKTSNTSSKSTRRGRERSREPVYYSDNEEDLISTSDIIDDNESIVSASQSSEDEIPLVDVSRFLKRDHSAPHRNIKRIDKESKSESAKTRNLKRKPLCALPRLHEQKDNEDCDVEVLLTNMPNCSPTRKKSGARKRNHFPLTDSVQPTAEIKNPTVRSRAVKKITENVSQDYHHWFENTYNDISTVRSARKMLFLERKVDDSEQSNSQNKKTLIELRRESMKVASAKTLCQKTKTDTRGLPGSNKKATSSSPKGYTFRQRKI